MQRNWKGHGNAYLQKPWMERMRLLAALLAALILLISMIVPTVFTLVFSFKDYSVTQGVAGSPSAGFSNYAAVFSAPGMLAAIGGTLLLSLLGGLFTCGLVTSAFYGLRNLANSRVRYTLAGVALLPCLFPAAQIAEVFNGFMTYHMAAPFMCALCQAVLAAPYILLILLAFKETTGEVSILAVALMAFGGGWYAGASNITVQLSFFSGVFGEGTSASLLSTLYTMDLPIAGSFSVRAILLTMQGVIAKIGLFAAIPLIHNLFTDSVNPTEKNKAIFGKGTSWKLALILPALLAALLPTISVLMTPTENSAWNLMPYLRLLTPLPGLILGGALAYFMYKKGKDIQAYGMLIALLLLMPLGKASVGQLFFRLYTATHMSLLPPLDLQGSTLVGFVIMAICFVYWEKKTDEHAWNRTFYAAAAALLLIGLGFVNDPAFGLLFGDTAAFDLSAKMSYLLLNASAPIPFVLPAINLLLAAGGVWTLEKAVKISD